VAATSPLLRIPTILDGLMEVEEALVEAVSTDDALLTEIAGHLIYAGGKRGRPALSIASAATAHPGDAVRREEVLGAVAVELVHLGSLYHDDVMDDAEMRRTVESVNARWGNLKAILAGDFLLAKASEIAASLGTEVAGLLAATIGKLCEGQVRELQHTYDVGRTEEQYLASIEGKTAVLFATACRIGALVAEVPRPWVDALTEFGRLYGMAFQVVDDVLDVVATDEQLGKPAGHDLVEGVYTLPVIRTLAAEGGSELRDLLGRPLDDAEKDRARKIVRANGAVDEAVTVAEDYIRQAVAALAPIGENEMASILAATAQDLLTSIPKP
jgi:heptaprenyl diphosphate synthase